MDGGRGGGGRAAEPPARAAWVRADRRPTPRGHRPRPPAAGAAADLGQAAERAPCGTAAARTPLPPASRPRRQRPGVLTLSQCVSDGSQHAAPACAPRAPFPRHLMPPGGARPDSPAAGGGRGRGAVSGAGRGRQVFSGAGGEAGRHAALEASEAFLSRVQLEPGGRESPRRHPPHRRFDS